MAHFDVNKWNKQRYLAEAGEEIQGSVGKAIADAIPEDYGIEDLAKDISYILKTYYGPEGNKYNKFMDIVHSDLGMIPVNEGELEDAAKKLNLTLNKKDNKIEVGGDAIDKDEFEGVAKKLGYKVDREVEKGEYDRLYISK